MNEDLIDVIPLDVREKLIKESFILVQPISGMPSYTHLRGPQLKRSQFLKITASDRAQCYLGSRGSVCLSITRTTRWS